MNIIHCIKRVKEKNMWSFQLMQKMHLTNLNIILWLKNTKKLEREGNYFNILKTIYEKPKDDKGLIFRLYKELLLPKKKTPNNLVLKMSEGHE